jgi:hypothetical protein
VSANDFHLRYAEQAAKRARSTHALHRHLHREVADLKAQYATIAAQDCQASGAYGTGPLPQIAGIIAARNTGSLPHDTLNTTTVSHLVHRRRTALRERLAALERADAAAKAATDRANAIRSDTTVRATTSLGFTPH